MLYFVYLTLREQGLAGYSILGLLGLAPILALGLVVMAAMPEKNEASVWRLRAIGWAAGICFGLGIAAAAAFVFASWRPLLEAETVRAWRPALTVTGQFDFIEQAGSGLLAAAAASLVFAVFLGLAAALWAINPARRAELSSTSRAILRVSLAGVAIAAAIGMTAYAWSAPSLLTECGSSDNVACIAQARLEAAKALSGARVGVIAVALLGGAIFTGASLWKRQASGLERRDTVKAALIFVIGLAGWIVTRGHAEDGRHPLSPRNLRDYGCPVWSFEPRRLPPARRCSSGENIVWLELRDGSLLVNGQPGALADVLSDLRSRREVWLGGRRPPVLIAAEADLPYAVAKPLLFAIQEAWDPVVEIVVVREPQFAPTATLGDIPRRPLCCATPLRLDAPGAATVATWGELAATASAP